MVCCSFQQWGTLRKNDNEAFCTVKTDMARSVCDLDSKLLQESASSKRTEAGMMALCTRELQPIVIIVASQRHPLQISRKNPPALMRATMAVRARGPLVRSSDCCRFLLRTVRPSRTISNSRTGTGGGSGARSQRCADEILGFRSSKQGPQPFCRTGEY